jgi:recombination protein U
MKQVRYANKGLGFEAVLNFTHDNYRKAGLAIVHKVPTEWLVRGDWRRGPVPVNPLRKGPCDYLGFAKLEGGRTVGLAIEAKESHQANSFPFLLEWDHEVEFLRHAALHGAKAFMLIHQVVADRVWLLPGDELFARWDAAYRGARGGRRSIPWRDLEDGAGQLVPSAPGFPVHYLPLLNGGRT